MGDVSESGILGSRCPVFVGRHGELLALEDAATRARAGRGGVVTILGEAGIGKSRLAREVLAAAAGAGMTTMEGGAVEDGSALAFRVVAEALMRALRGGVPDAAELAPYRSALGAVVPDLAGGTAPSAPASTLFVQEAIVRLLRVLAGAHGLVVLLEDLQWADAETLDWIDYLLRTVASERILCVCTARLDESEQPAPLLQRIARSPVGSLIELQRLDADEIDAITAGVLGTALLRDDVTAAVRARSEGLPLAAEEVIGDLLARRGLVREEDTWHLEGTVDIHTTPTFRALVDRRLSALDAGARDILRTAATLGTRFEWSLLAPVCDTNDVGVLVALRLAAGIGLVVEEGGNRFAFRHALLRDAVLSTLLAAERARLAGRAAAVLDAQPGHESRDRVELSARLRLAAGDRHGAAEKMLELGRDALARTALQSAESALEQARSLGDGDAELVIAVDEALIETASRSGQAARALALARGVATRLAAPQIEPRRRLAAQLRVVRSALDAGTLDEAAAVLDAVAGHAEGPDRAEISARRAILALEMSDAETARREAHAAVGHAESTGAAEMMCEALYVLGRVIRNIDPDPAAALAPLERMVAEASSAGLAHWEIRGLLELALVDFTTTNRRDRAERARGLAVEHGAVDVVALVDVHCVLAIMGTQNEEAAATIDEAVEVSRRLELPTLGFALQVKGVVQAILGDRVGHDATVAELRRGALHPFDAVAAAGWAIVRGSVAEVVDALDLVYGDPGQPWPRRRVGQAAPFRAMWALARTVVDRDGDAARARIVEEGYGSWRNRGQVALAEAVALGRSGDRRGAEDRVAEFESASGDPTIAAGFVHAARIWVAPCAHRDGWGDPAGWLRGARAHFEAGGIVEQVRRCDAELRAMGEVVPRRGRGDSVVPPHLRRIGVTSREMDVLALVAEGLSNSDIAVRLVVSPRTVETHVSRLLARTGARTRVQLAAAIHGTPPAG